MGEVLEALIEKLPSAYLMTLIPLLLVLGIYVVRHIRRDKQGKLMWYSDIYEHRKQDRKLEVILSQQTDAAMRIVRLEILNAIHNAPQKVEVIMHLYDEYKKTYKGNSYLDATYEAWKSKYAQQILDARI